VKTLFTLMQHPTSALCLLITRAITAYLNNNLQFSSTDEYRYHEALVHPAMSMAKKEITFWFGGGDGLAVREILKYKDVKACHSCRS
jgi:predicted membrane-bound spermidine synthase